MSNTFDAQHEDMLHDAQLDYYSKRLATCSSDRVIKVFNIGADQTQTHAADLTGHEGPVWQVAWAHPRFGSLLASCGYDRKVMVWRENPSNVWTRVYEYTGHEASVNSVAWGPQENGLVLACGSSDGSVSVLSHNDDDSWTARVIRDAHRVGCNSVSWSPAFESNTNGSNGNNNSGNDVRLVTGGCDNLLNVWRYLPGESRWALEEALSEHRDWVRTVAWAPNAGVPVDVIASGSQDGEVIIWSRDHHDTTCASSSSSTNPGPSNPSSSNNPSKNEGGAKSKWAKKKLPRMPAVVYGVSWSPMGNILAVASGDNKVSLWKESLDGEWNKISNVAENGQMS